MDWWCWRGFYLYVNIWLLPCLTFSFFFVCGLLQENGVFTHVLKTRLKTLVTTSTLVTDVLTKNSVTFKLFSFSLINHIILCIERLEIPREFLPFMFKFFVLPILPMEYRQYVDVDVWGCRPFPSTDREEGGIRLPSSFSLVPCSADDCSVLVSTFAAAITSRDASPPLRITTQLFHDLSLHCGDHATLSPHWLMVCGNL